MDLANEQNLMAKASGRTEVAHRLATPVKWVSAAAIIAALLVIARALPVERGVAVLEGWVDDLGVWGPVAFGAVYALGAVLFVPGSPMTIAAGAVFGLWWGVVTVSIASTGAAAAAFLIARYLARGAIEAKARQFPRFGAIDRAIGQGGAKIIAMLRLSPAVPFSIGNYLFGLTAIRFWPYVLASWIFMLPGTFLYVYLGYAARTGAESSEDQGSGKKVLMVIGLLATVAVTAYVTRLARRALQEYTPTEPTELEPPSQSDPGKSTDLEARGWPWDATALAGLAVVMLAAAASAHWNRDVLQGLLGPAPVQLVEAYEKKPDGPSFDHSKLDTLLHKHVDQDGWVDYEGLQGDTARLNEYITSLGRAPFDRLGRDEKLALLINAYNAFTLRLILDHYPVRSIKDIRASKRWDDKRWRIGEAVFSLNQIEHEQIRPKFAEPRVHFALVCAAIGCPKLRNEAYQADRVEQQLEDQTRYAHSHDRWFRFDKKKGVVYLTKLYDWYQGDFEQAADSVREFAARYAPALKQALRRGDRLRTAWLDYDWTLNDKRNAR